MSVRSLKREVERRMTEHSGDVIRNHSALQCYSLEVRKGDVKLIYEEHLDWHTNPTYERLEVTVGSEGPYVFERCSIGEKISGGKDPRKIMRKTFRYQKKQEAKK